MKQDDLKNYRKAIRTVPEANNEDEICLLFLENLFQAMYNFNTTHQDIHDGVSAFYNLFLYPVARAISTELDFTKTDFCDGEVCLESMSIQLKSLNMMVDDRNMYKADGVVRIYGFKRLKILVLETSYHFGSTDQRKSKFDHHKGLFGILIKVFFVHATNRTVYFWIMSLAPGGSIYDLWLEDTLEIKPDIGDKLDAIPILLGNERDLKKEHDSTLMKNIFKFSSCLRSLSIIVNPSILHLTEEEDKAGMSELGPLFSPKR
ncbi:MAG: hypothetical protein EXX96DRAFT_593713 [Benjaminiella poitrasii]|nr:MAG: hypothetical protein EXX96DRAFT_593713 [Benjaminiella poitrasii]